MSWSDELNRADSAIQLELIIDFMTEFNQLFARAGES